MAQPIPLQLPPRDTASRGIPEADKHADAIASSLELLQLLHDRGVVELLRGMVGAGDQLVGTVTAAVDTPESLRAIRNFLLLTKFFGSIPPDVLSSLVHTAVKGAEREKACRPPGIFHLLRRLLNPDSRHAMAVGLDLLESVGKGL
jgi:uncharacterized protein YjgD (DUF1641 family)